MTTTTPHAPALTPYLVDAESLPSPPPIVMEIAKRAEADDVTIPELAGLIGKDAPLAAKLVRMSNSSMFNLGREITSIDRALMLLGLKTVKMLAISLSLRTLMPGGTSELNDGSATRRRSLVSAVVGRHLMEKVEPELADEAFLAGLLSNIGLIAIADRRPDHYDALFVETAWPSAARQHEVLGFPVDVLSAELLDRWGMHGSFGLAIANCGSHEPTIVDDARANTLAVVLRAARAAEELLCGVENDAGTAIGRLFALAERDLDLNRDEVEQVLLETEPVIAETAELLSFDLPPGSDHAMLVATAMASLQTFTVDMAAAANQNQRQNEELRAENQQLAETSRTDALTGLMNRGAFDEEMARQIAARQRQAFDDQLGLLVLDLDKFKSVNDTYGHASGDAVLRSVAHVLAQQVRTDEVVARFGGEEFVVILPHANADSLFLAGERLRRAIEATIIGIPSGTLQVTASFGGALLVDPHARNASEDTFHRADEALYTSKQTGRNRVTIV